jgi:hypothetical protein
MTPTIKCSSKVVHTRLSLSFCHRPQLDFEELDAQYHISDGLKELGWSCYLTRKDHPEARIYPDGGCLIRELRNDSDDFDPEEATEVVCGFFSGLTVTSDEAPICYILNVEADGLYLFGEPGGDECDANAGQCSGSCDNTK